MSKRQHKPASVHVVPRKGEGWAVKKEGNDKASRVVDTKAEAVDIGRKQAQNSGAELVVHNTDGKIGFKDSHGHDPSSSKG